MSDLASEVVQLPLDSSQAHSHTGWGNKPAAGEF
jgi:hypothetical protein